MVEMRNAKFGGARPPGDGTEALERQRGGIGALPSGTTTASRPAESHAAFGRLRCRLGFHDYRYVGFQWTYETPWLTSGHSHECWRCGKTTYWATGIVNEGDASPLTKAVSDLERLL